jgi:hypothetical protein
MNPWFGGIQPRLGSLPAGELSQERFRAREIERRGSQRILWRGVRVSCSPKHERARHERLAVDYLLAPGSSILAVAVRTTRRADTAGWIEGGFEVWPVLGGSHLEAVLSGDSDVRAARLRCEFAGWVRGDRWLIAENPRAKEAVLLGGPGGEASVSGEVLGTEGYALGANHKGMHEARQTRESVFFIGFTSTNLAPDLAETLSQLEQLP